MKFKLFKDKIYLTAFAIEIVGISVVTAGISYEYCTHETIGYIFITTGSLTVAIGSLVYAKIYKRLKHIK
jgi:hypothetical protein